MHDPLYRYSIQTPEYEDISDDAFSPENNNTYNKIHQPNKS